jgi:hypothetical protein
MSTRSSIFLLHNVTTIDKVRKQRSIGTRPQSGGIIMSELPLTQNGKIAYWNQRRELRLRIG